MMVVAVKLYSFDKRNSPGIEITWESREEKEEEKEDTEELKEEELKEEELKEEELKEE